MMQGRKVLALIVSIFAWVVMSNAQTPALLVSYPEYILYNGKVVTVDNPDTTTNLGTITQAVSVRQGKILAVGSNAQIQILAGPQTKSIDLKGRTVLPGLISTHEHIPDWAYMNPRAYGTVVTDNDAVSRYLTGTPKEQAAKLQPTIVEAVRAAKPGQWIRIYSDWGYLRVNMGAVSAAMRPVISKSILDNLAPNNPIVVIAGAGGVVNCTSSDNVGHRA